VGKSPGPNPHNITTQKGNKRTGDGGEGRKRDRFGTLPNRNRGEVQKLTCPKKPKVSSTRGANLAKLRKVRTVGVNRKGGERAKKQSDAVTCRLNGKKSAGNLIKKNEAARASCIEKPKKGKNSTKGEEREELTPSNISYSKREQE